jgi:soluble cytochrome b562
MDISAIILLAQANNTNEDDIFSEFDSELFKEAQKENELEAKKAAVSSIRELLRATETMKVTKRADIRRYREMINALKAGLDKMDRAIAYAKETSNFLPLVAVLTDMGHYVKMSGVTMSEYQKLNKIPDNWSPKAE